MSGNGDEPVAMGDGMDEPQGAASKRGRRVGTATEELRRAMGGFLVDPDATDRMLRDLHPDSPLQQAIRASKGAAGAFVVGRDPAISAIGRAEAEAAGLVRGRATRSLLDQAEGTVAHGTAARLRKEVDALTRFVDPTAASIVARQSVAEGVLRATRDLSVGRFVDAGMLTSVSHLRDEFGGSYGELMRRIGSAGSLGGLAARLATGRREDLAGPRAMLADVAARAETALADATMAAGIRRSHPSLLPPLRQPTASEIERVVAMTGDWAALSPYPDWVARAKAGVAALRSPWVRADRPDLSIEAVSLFGRLGGAVVNLDPGGPTVVAEIGSLLGDSRSEPYSDEADDDPLVRTGERYDRGFDPVLSSMPTKLVALLLAPFGLVLDEDAAEGEHWVADMAGQILRRVEGALMAFVRTTLDRAWGDDWVAHVPGDVRGALRRRAAADAERGRSAFHPLAYADFGSWIGIISRDENWPLFAPTFGSADLIRDALEQIRPIRNDAAHPRGVVPEDLITLAVQGKRVLRWIGRR